MGLQMKNQLSIRPKTDLSGTSNMFDKYKRSKQNKKEIWLGALLHSTLTQARVGYSSNPEFFLLCFSYTIKTYFIQTRYVGLH